MDNTFKNIIVNSWDIFRSAIFAGLFIGIAGFGFLVNKQIGMFMFIFGLASIVNYREKLFTGTAGFVGIGTGFWDSMYQLMLILIGNIVGCFAVAMMVRCSSLQEIVQENAIGLLTGRLTLDYWKCGIQSIGCGMLMTTAVTFAKKEKTFGSWVPLLFAVPMFIFCGFPHCIADAFYYMCVPFDGSLWTYSWEHILKVYGCIVAGNFVGCNLYRLLTYGEGIN